MTTNTSTKFLLAAAIFSTAGMLRAQTAAPAASAPVKAVTTKADAAKPTVKPAAPASAAGTAAKKRAVRRSALKAVEEVTPIDEDLNVKLSERDMEIAKRVYVGVIPCELGASVTITANAKRPGFFLVQTKTAKFNMHPVEARTGAIRLEDPRGGALWIQLGNKSMLMSQKLGQRLADECMSPAQVTLADELKKNPIPGLLDAPKPASAASAAVTATAASAPAIPASAAK